MNSKQLSSVSGVKQGGSGGRSLAIENVKEENGNLFKCRIDLMIKIKFKNYYKKYMKCQIKCRCGGEGVGGAGPHLF
jgi:hypothetical protein